MSNLQQLVSKQITRWEKDRQQLERWLKEQEQPPATRPAEVKPIVTLSRQRGCFGSEFAKLLSNNLQYGILDRQIIDYIAEHLGVRSELVEMLDEDDRSEFELRIQELISGHLFDHDDYIRALGEVIKSAQLHGAVVIVGRGANYILRSENVYRIRLVAPLEARVQKIMEQEGKTEDEARENIEEVDENRSQFVDRYFRQDINTPEDYDMIINTATHSLTEAIRPVMEALRARGWVDT